MSKIFKIIFEYQVFVYIITVIYLFFLFYSGYLGPNSPLSKSNSERAIVDYLKNKDFSNYNIIYDDYTYYIIKSQKNNKYPVTYLQLYSHIDGLVKNNLFNHSWLAITRCGYVSKFQQLDPSIQYIILKEFYEINRENLCISFILP